MWQHFHHQADIGIRGIGESLEEAFEQAAVALIEVICTPGHVSPSKSVDIQCTADDSDLLFADWINALIYEMDINRMLLCRFEVHIDNHQLSATAYGEPADPDKHEMAVEVKAATYMELKVYRNDRHQWVAQCVVDV